MMGSCLSCCDCCGDANSSPTSSRYKKRNRQGQNSTNTRKNRPIQSTCFECGSLRCTCDATSDSAAGLSSGTETETDIEMGGVRSKHHQHRSPTFHTLKDGQSIAPALQDDLEEAHAVNAPRQQVTIYDLHSHWTLKRYPPSKAPRNRQNLFTQSAPVIVDSVVEGLLRWIKKGSWIDILTGVVASQPPKHFYDIETLKSVPMRFELIPKPTPPSAEMVAGYLARHDNFAALHSFTNTPPTSHLLPDPSNASQVDTQWTQFNKQGRFVSQNVQNFHQFTQSALFSSQSFSSTHPEPSLSHVDQICINVEGPRNQSLQYDPTFLAKMSYKHRFYYDFGVNLSFVDDAINDVCYGNSITATTPSLFNALFYIPWLYKELSLYPRLFLEKIGLKNIILAEELSYLKQSRKAIPVVVSQTLYLDVGLEPVYYMQGVFHHELFHLFDDKLLFELKKPIKNPCKLYNFGKTPHKSSLHLSKLLLHTKPATHHQQRPSVHSQSILNTTLNTTPSTDLVSSKPLNELSITASNQPNHNNPPVDDSKQLADHLAIDLASLETTSLTPSNTSPTQSQPLQLQQPQQPQQPLPSSSHRSSRKVSTSNLKPPQLDPRLPYRSNTIDPFTSFSHFLLTEWIHKHPIVFSNTVIPYIMNSYSERGITHITPKAITQTLLAMLSFLFNLSPYFFRSFPCILHLFKHPHYIKHQLHYGGRGNQNTTGPLIDTPDCPNSTLSSTTDSPLTTPSTPTCAFITSPLLTNTTTSPIPITSLTLSNPTLPSNTGLNAPTEVVNQLLPVHPTTLFTPPIISLALSNSTITSSPPTQSTDLIHSINPYNVQPTPFHAPPPSLLHQYLSNPPIFLLRPQKHSLLNEFYKNHPENPLNSIYTDPANPPSFDPSLPINNYPSYNIILQDLFHTSIPNYSRGNLYLTYLRTPAISDFIPNEYKHPLFPHERYYYQTHQTVPPQCISPPPQTTNPGSPFQHLSFPSLPAISTYQELFWSQSATEAIRQGINPQRCPAHPDPPGWFRPNTPLRSEPVGSDPLWMLLNYKEFRYGSGGCNQRNADASVTLNKATNQQQSNSNQQPPQQKTKDNTSQQNLVKKPNLGKNSSGENEDELVQLSTHRPSNSLTFHRTNSNPHHINNNNNNNNTINDNNHNAGCETDADTTDCAHEDDNHSTGRVINIQTHLKPHSSSEDDRNSHSTTLLPTSSFTIYSTASFSSINPSNMTNNNSNPQHSKDLGFLNTYSMSAIEEDKAEVYSWLIRHPPSILNSPDPYIRAKGLELWRRLELFCADIDETFLLKLIHHKPFQIDPYHSGWKVQTDFRGYTSWFNDQTGQSSWVDPALLSATMPLFQHSQSSTTTQLPRNHQ